MGTHRAAAARPQRRHLAQLDDRRPRQAILDRLRPHTPLTSTETPVNDLALHGELTNEEISQLAGCALSSKCPELRDEEAVTLVTLFWNEPRVRAARGWDSLLTLVRDPLPGGWQ